MPGFLELRERFSVAWSAAAEVIRKTELVKNGSQPVRQIFACGGTGGRCLRAGVSVCEPVLVFDLCAKVKPVCKLVVETCTAGEHPVMLGHAEFLECRGKVEGTAATEGFNIGVVTTIGAVVAGANLVAELAGARMLIDINEMEISFDAIVGLEVERSVGASSLGVLRGVIRIGKGKRTTYLQVTSSGRIGRSLSQSESRARSKQGEDEDVSFQRGVSVWAGLGIFSSFSLFEMEGEIPQEMRKILNKF
jgi:hypothetical protein